ncbi:MAG: Smr/MutS family protein [Saprospiraceae bacterium]|nr:Smr/MutS family protein [Saprospiraceae bacterium]
MLYAVGTKVRLIHTGDEGRVIGLLSNGMFNVHVLDDDMVIPVSPEDLAPFTETTSHPAKTPTPPQPSSPTSSPSSSKADTTVTSFSPEVLSHQGLFLAFEPILQADATAEKYLVKLINDSSYDLLFQYALYLEGVVEEKVNNKLKAASIMQLGQLWYDELNDSPEVQIAIWRITTDGTGGKQEKRIRLKAKTFFKSTQIAPLLHQSVHLFPVFDNLNTERRDSKENLQTYTKRMSRPKTRINYVGDKVNIDTMAFAEFPTELDLHIEKLLPDSRKLDKRAILRVQLEAFENYINQAIRLGIERVFVIHGVGEGKLRNAIATRLIKYPEVVSFKNEFHPRYGFGATEVIF